MKVSGLCVKVSGLCWALSSLLAPVKPYGRLALAGPDLGREYMSPLHSSSVLLFI